MFQSASPSNLDDLPVRRAPTLAKALTAALVVGLLAGTVDLLTAALNAGLSPLIILRAVASGAYGPQAFAAPEWIEVVGLILQWAMTILIGAIYTVAALGLPSLIRRPIPWGLAYGFGIYVVMTFVVVPLSNAPHTKDFAPGWVPKSIAAMLLCGLIISLVSSRMMRGGQK